VTKEESHIEILLHIIKYNSCNQVWCELCPLKSADEIVCNPGPFTNNLKELAKHKLKESI
jgi:hypothetical protein